MGGDHLAGRRLSSWRTRSWSAFTSMSCSRKWGWQLIGWRALSPRPSGWSKRPRPTPPCSRIAAARMLARTIREDDFPNRGCRRIWRDLYASWLNPHSAAEIDAAELRGIAERVDEMRRLLAMFPT